MKATTQAAGAPSHTSPTRSAVEVRRLCKTFPGTRALSGVDLDVRPGEIHALIGGNGSGKSTLIKILCGVHKGDPGGTLRVGDTTFGAETSTPDIARRSGVRVVHQDLGVFPDMSVAENLALGSHYETNRTRGIDWRSLRRRAEDLIRRFDIDAAPDTELRALGPAVRTQVAIARALQGQSDASRGLLILDEPTASLPAAEVEVLLSHLRRYAAEGQAILYVSHRLDEILDIADRVSALRDGGLVGTFERSQVSEGLLVDLIVGRAAVRTEQVPVRSHVPAIAFLARGLSVGPLRDVTLDVGEGEILGVAGLLGSGRTKLLRAVFGDLPIRGGEMELAGARHRPAAPRDAMRAGVAYVPENRVQDSVFQDQSIATNIALPALDSYFSRGRVAQDRLLRDAGEDVRRFLVKANDAHAVMSTLSGGNQQKVVIARWLRLAPRLLLLDEPTQGVDVGARAEIYRLVREATHAGTAVILVASDFEELTTFCDRIVVLRDGRIAGELRGEAMMPHRVAELTLKVRA